MAPIAQRSMSWVTIIVWSAVAIVMVLEVIIPMCGILQVTGSTSRSEIIREQMVAANLGPKQNNPPSPPSQVNVYDLLKPISRTRFECVNLKTQPVVPICIYSNTTDYLSCKFKNEGVYEPDELKVFQAYLRRYDDYGMIDVGANVGYYSLIAAKMGHKVVSVEPITSNVERFHTAAVLGGAQHNITLLNNGVANKRGVLPINIPKGNVGGSSFANANIVCGKKVCPYVQMIHLEDIAHFVTFSSAIMKVDIEGFEQRAFARAARLFSVVDIPVVFMEMMNCQKHCVGKETEDKQMMRDMLKFFADRKYVPYWPDKPVRVDHLNCRQWPINVVWVREGVQHPPK